MTILFLTRLFYPHIGGVETHVLEVSQELSLLGHKIVVITEQYQKNLKEKDILDNIEIYRIPVGKNGALKKFQIWRWLWKNRDLMRNTDIIHCHDVFFWFLPFRFLYPQKSAYVTFHGYETRFPPAKKAVLLRKISETLSSGNICVGDYIQKWYGTKPNYVTYGGISKIQNSRLAPAATQGAAKRAKLKILFIGRLENDTDLLTYLEVLRILRKTGIDFEFEVCGDGLLRKLAEEQGRVHGFVPNLKTHLTRSDLVFSSSYLSILQALIFKRPVFAVYKNPLKEGYLKMAPFAKWIFIADSPKQIAKMVEDMRKNPNKAELMADKAYNWVKNQTWDEVVNLYLKLWRM